MDFLQFLSLNVFHLRYFYRLSWQVLGLEDLEGMYARIFLFTFTLSIAFDCFGVVLVFGSVVWRIYACIFSFWFDCFYSSVARHNRTI